MKDSTLHLITIIQS